MIEIQRIKEKTNEVLAGIGKRNIDATKEIAQIIALDSDWREKKTQLQQLETDFRYGVSLGFSFQFGSIFNNVVNNRFRNVEGFSGRPW